MHNKLMRQPHEIPEKILGSFSYRLILSAWFLFVILSPFYIFDSGLPQPADLIIAPFCALAIILFFLKSSLTIDRVFTPLILMCGLCGAINSIYALSIGDIRFAYAVLYYVFNAAVFAATCILFTSRPESMRHIARMAVIGAVLLEAGWILLTGDHASARETGSFNNPNQLGYWALLSAACLVTVTYRQKMTWVDVAVLILCGFIVMESLSRAAIIAFVPVFLAVMFGQSISVTVKTALAAFICLTIAVQFLAAAPVIERMDFFAHHDPYKFAERGYQRLSEFPHYMIFGAGEGAYWRFGDPARPDLEIHSGLATLLFSYGLFGLALFLTVLYGIFRRAPLLLLLPLGGVMLYGLTHQHIRFTGFWIYLGLSYGMIRHIFGTRYVENGDEKPS